MKIHIVGGGFSGLTLAYFLVQKKQDVVIYEKEHWGGCIHTITHRGAFIETAANGFLVSPRFEEVSSEIGAKIRGVDGPQKRYIYSENKPRQWPLGLLESMPFLGFIFKFLFRRAEILPKSRETVSTWARRNLSANILRKMIEPALRGIYAGDVERLSATLILGKFFQKEKVKSNSNSNSNSNSPTSYPTKSKQRGLMTGIQGMEGWLKDLMTYLQKQGVEFRQESVSDVGGFLAAGETVVIATPPQGAIDLLERIGDRRSETLKKIEMLPLASVTVLTEEATPLKGFGCLFPSSEKKISALGVLFRQSFFPEKSAPHQERWILDWNGESEQELLLRVEQNRHQLWPQKVPRIHAQHVKIWPQALPHYTTELEAQILSLEDRNSKVYLHGNYLGALGLTALLERSFNLAENLSEK